MSRPSTSRSGGGGPTAAPVTTMTNADGEEQCPICKTLRYMNRNLIFLINPECYHPLCNNCVDRLFENGPNQCPYIGCHKTLRKKGFREPKFGDLNVEREVDIRKRVAAIFNKGEEDFEDLKAYNDYLDMVETLTMDLVYGSEKEQDAASQRLLAWEYEHRLEIEKNRKHGERLREQTRKQFAAEQKAAAQRRADAARQEEEERLRKARQREEDLDMLASAPTGAASKIMLKKRGQNRREAVAESEAAAMRAAQHAAANGGLAIKGLKRKPNAAASAAAEDTGPYDPLGKLDLRPSRYVLQPTYKNEFLDTLLQDPKLQAGGYNVQEYYSRALFEAFAGLAVFVSDEKETGGVGMDHRGVATQGASMAANSEPGTIASFAGSRRQQNNSGDVIKKSSSNSSSQRRGADATRRAVSGGLGGFDGTPPLPAGVTSEDGDVQMRDYVKPEPSPPVVKMEVDNF